MKTIDFHTHILPKADHGSDSLETSLEQVKLAKSAEIDTLVATSHFYPHMHRVKDFVNKREACYNELAAHTDIEILLGAEILLCDGLNKLSGIENLAIGDSKVLLIELPFTSFKREYEASIEALIDQGYKVVLAHADRYPKENIDRLIPLGAKIQLNVSSLVTLFPKKHLYDWIDKGIVVALGSDIHKADKKAYASFIKAKKKLGDRFNQIMQKSNDLISK